MTREEAIALITAKYPNHYIDKVTETKRYFIVCIIPKNVRRPKGIKVVSCDDGLKAVVKETKQIFTYNPIRDGE